MKLSTNALVADIKGRGEFSKNHKNIRFVLVEGVDDQKLFKKFLPDWDDWYNQVWCWIVGPKERVIEAVTELHSSGYHCGVGIVDLDYDQEEYPDGVISLEKNNLESLLLSSDSFDSAIRTFDLDYNQEENDEMMDFIKSNGKEMAIIRIINHDLDEAQSFSCDELSNAIVSKGFNSKKFAELCLKKPHPRGKRHLEEIRDGRHKIVTPQNFNSNCWRWINGKDGIELTIQFIKNVSNILVDGKKMKKKMIDSYLPIHFNSEREMIEKIVSYQNAHNVELFRPEALSLE